MIVWLKAIRIHQWVKNVLIFIPLLTSHNFFDPSKVFITLICFISFCFCSSAGYLINDCLDIQSDKSHPISKARPIAQGIINRSLALFVSFIFVLFGLLIAGMYSKKLIVFLIVYLIISICCYTLYYISQGRVHRLLAPGPRAVPGSQGGGSRSSDAACLTQASATEANDVSKYAGP